METRTVIILLLGVILLAASSPILSVNFVEAGKDKDNDDDNDKDRNDDDNQLSEYDIAVLCGATEDYQDNKEQCDKLYEMLEKGIIEDDPDFEYD